jgi:hypothetical protein
MRWSFHPTHAFSGFITSFDIATLGKTAMQFPRKHSLQINCFASTTTRTCNMLVSGGSDGLAVVWNSDKGFGIISAEVLSSVLGIILHCVNQGNIVSRVAITESFLLAYSANRTKDVTKLSFWDLDSSWMSFCFHATLITRRPCR